MRRVRSTWQGRLLAGAALGQALVAVWFLAVTDADAAAARVWVSRLQIEAGRRIGLRVPEAEWLWKACLAARLSGAGNRAWPRTIWAEDPGS